MTCRQPTGDAGNRQRQWLLLRQHTHARQQMDELQATLSARRAFSPPPMLLSSCKTRVSGDEQHTKSEIVEKQHGTTRLALSIVQISS